MIQNIAVSILLFMFLILSYQYYAKVKFCIRDKKVLDASEWIGPALLGALTWFVYHL